MPDCGVHQRVRPLVPVAAPPGVQQGDRGLLADADSLAMKLNVFWHDFLAEMGNEPGAQQGNVTIHFVNPVDGAAGMTGPSGAVEVAAEAGSVIGVMVLAAGRRMFVPVSKIAGIVDTPKDDKSEKADKPSHARSSGRSSASSS